MQNNNWQDQMPIGLEHLNGDGHPALAVQQQPVRNKAQQGQQTLRVRIVSQFFQNAGQQVFIVPQQNQRVNVQRRIVSQIPPVQPQ